MVLSTRQKIIFALILLGGFMLIGLVAAPYVPRMRDFDQTYYPAIRYALTGQNPYTSDYLVTDQGAPPAFFNPAWYLIVLLPFGLLPFRIARAEWMIFLIIVTCTSLGLMKWWGFDGRWSLALAALPWSLIAILYGQPTSLILLGAILAISQVAQAEENRPSGLLILSGFILMGIKPQLGLFTGLPLSLWLFWRRDKRLKVIIGGGLIFLGLMLLLSPPWPIATAIETQEHLAPWWKSTLEREFSLWGVPVWLAWPVRLAVVVMMLIWVWQEGDLTPAWWSAMLAAVLIITPYTRAYDSVLLLPLLGQMIAQYKWRFLIFLIGVTAYTSLPQGELGSVVTPLIAWLLSGPWVKLFVSPCQKALNP